MFSLPSFTDKQRPLSASPRPLDAQQIRAHVLEQWQWLRHFHGNGHVSRIAIFGAGAHSTWLQSTVQGIEGPHVVAILDDSPAEKPPLWGKNPISPTSWNPTDIDAIVLSSDTVVEQMKKRCQQLYGTSVRLIHLYDRLPPGPYPKTTPLAQPIEPNSVTGHETPCRDNTTRSLIINALLKRFDRWLSNYLPDPAIVHRDYPLRWKLHFAGYAYRLKKRFKDCHRGQEAILVGSGPSVRIEDLENFKRCVTFACNRFYRCYDRTSFRPTYLVSADPSMVNDFREEMIRESKCPLFFNTADKPVGHQPDVFWLPSTIPHRAPLVFQETMYRGLFSGGGTLISAIQIGYFMGIRKFYLYGVDHNFNFQKVETPDKARSAIGDGNHFIPNYRDGKAWFPPATRLIEQSFGICDSFLRSRGGFLMNATRGGKLEVLERINIEEVMAKWA